MDVSSFAPIAAKPRVPDAAVAAAGPVRAAAPFARVPTAPGACAVASAALPVPPTARATATASARRVAPALGAMAMARARKPSQEGAPGRGGRDRAGSPWSWGQADPRTK